VAARYIDLDGTSYPEFHRWMSLEDVNRKLVNQNLNEIRRSVALQLRWP